MRTRRYLVVTLVALIAIVTTFACDLPGQSPTSTPCPECPEPAPSLTAVVCPTDTPEPTVAPYGTISGVMWHDICEFTGGQAGEPVVLGLGCEELGLDEWQFGPNQIFDEFEVGWEGVTIHLGVGACPSTGMAFIETNSDGEYLFSAIPPGTYCVSYDPLADGNDAILVPGSPTYPIRGEAGRYWTVELAEGEEAIRNFGYAWQFFD